MKRKKKVFALVGCQFFFSFFGFGEQKKNILKNNYQI